MTRTAHVPEKEAQLVLGCQAQDAKAQDELLRRFHAPILHVVRRSLARLRAPVDLDEDIAATFWFDLLYHKPWRLRAYCPDRGCLKTYLAGIARLTVLDFLARERRQRLATLPPSDLDCLTPRVEDFELQEELDHLLGNLSEAERALLKSFLHNDPAAQATPRDGQEAKQAAACHRQRKKRLIHKTLQILGLQHSAEKSEKNGDWPVTNGPQDLG